MSNHRATCVGGLLLTACSVALAVSVRAQPQAPSTSAPRLVFDHDARDVAGFALYVDGGPRLHKRIDLGMPTRDPNGGFSVPVPSLPDGIYVLSMAAYGEKGESTPAMAPESITVIDGVVVPAHAQTPHATAVVKPTAAKPRPAPQASVTKKDADKPPKKKGGFLSGLRGLVLGDDDKP